MNQFSKQIAKYGNGCSFSSQSVLIATVTSHPNTDKWAIANENVIGRKQSYQKTLNRIKEGIFWKEAIFQNFEIVSRIQESFDHVTGKRELENEFK